MLSQFGCVRYGVQALTDVASVLMLESKISCLCSKVGRVHKKSRVRSCFECQFA